MKNYQRIKDLREDKDLTQSQISEILKMHKTQYCRYEQGISAIPFDFIIQLSQFYKVSIDYIAGLTNSKGGLHKISSEEKELLNKYNSLNEKRKGKAELYLELLAEQQEEENAQTQETA